MFTRQQKTLLNSIIIGANYRDLSLEWVLGKVAIMYEFSPNRDDIKEPIKELYTTIKNMLQGEWRDTQNLLPFIVI